MTHVSPGDYAGSYIHYGIREHGMAAAMNGIALHGGFNPGYPASHGCIRLPVAFAKKLYSVTDIGTPIYIGA